MVVLVVSYPLDGAVVVGLLIEVSVAAPDGAVVLVVSYLPADGLAGIDVVSEPLVMVLSPRSGAAPVSSAPRLWHAANVAAAARIQRVFIVCS